jgi:hypothetical protein
MALAIARRRRGSMLATDATSAGESIKRSAGTPIDIIAGTADSPA